MRKEFLICDKCRHAAENLEDLVVGNTKLGEICEACKTDLLPPEPPKFIVRAVDDTPPRSRISQPPQAGPAAPPHRDSSTGPKSAYVMDAIRVAASTRTEFTAADVAKVMGTSTYQASHRLGHYISTGKIVRTPTRGVYRLPTPDEMEATTARKSGRATA